MLDLTPNGDFKESIAVPLFRAVNSDIEPYLRNWPLIYETFKNIYVTVRGSRKTIGKHCAGTPTVFIIISTMPNSLISLLQEEILRVKSTFGFSPTVISATFLPSARTFLHVEETTRGLSIGSTAQQIFISDVTIEGLNTILLAAHKDAIAWIRLSNVVPAAELSLLITIMSATKYYWVECLNDLWIVCTEFEKTLTKGPVRKLATGYSRPMISSQGLAATILDEISAECSEFYSSKIDFNLMYRVVYAWPQ